MRLLRLPAVLACAFSLCVLACGIAHSSRQVPKLIVLGVDGMDPGFVERHWESLPNLAAIRHQGYFGRLQTTFPPQSPVAWSTFITGLEPAQHGMFDFVHRNARTLQPFSSMSKTEAPRWTLGLGPYLLPLSSPHVVSLRKGVPFWQVLSQRGIPVTILHMPTNYPPLAFGMALSGMGTPDLRGTLGTFTLYTDDPAELSHAVSGGLIVKVHLQEGHVLLRVEGPPNTLLKGQPYTSVNLTADVDVDETVARLSQGEATIILREGEWSDWISADFSLIPHISSVHGMFRVYAKQLHPRFELYVSPVNIDPISPALPVSSPPDWARIVATETGRFFTLGIPEDTSALRQHALNLSEFRSQARIAFEEERAVLRYALRHFNGGLLFSYFSSVDQSSHILWGRHDAELLNVYREVDDCIGEVHRTFPSARLLILSDHGFTTFDRAVHLNTWLRDRGFLKLAEPPGDETSLTSIDWTATEAYAIGLNGLYLNRAGREAHGIVRSGEEGRGLTENLREQLLAWQDPINQRRIVETVQAVTPSPQNVSVAPDLIVGYSPGFRASWQTALGGTPDLEIEDNTDAWIADHCVNPADVPGVLFSSCPIGAKKERIEDVTALILRFFEQGS